MTKRINKRVEQAFNDGVNYAFDLIDAAMKIKGIGPKTQEKIMVGLQDLANHKKHEQEEHLSHGE